MDWAPTEMQQAIQQLSREILSSAEDPWSELAKAELLDLEDVLEITTLLVEVGRAGARVPVFPTLVLGAPLREFGESPGAGTVLTGGLMEERARDPRHARASFTAGRLLGEKTCVPVATEAEWMVVPIRDGRVHAVRLADCLLAPQVGTDGDRMALVGMDHVRSVDLGGREVLDWWLPRVDVGVCAVLLGLSQKALRLTTRYVTQREQFGRPIGSFQAVQQRIADAWIQTQVMEVSLWQAAWRVQAGLESTRERAIARYWASEGSHFVCAAAQHLHGGFGYDTDYELHRYFLAAKQHEFLLGGANAQLAVLGDLLADSATA